ncbi:lysocardiolipin acyltransferase 1-like [Agrilus planipennis]|uniref:Lysocardiolipin acyltransferase 1-like n=1 Tax=Agrilus planipennis TaxID=224129 RepID=A0A1W4XDW2_AGRPL|nr:lysocardiolipin acyltransferase 1-like [Agrilus planipennis]
MAPGTRQCWASRLTDFFICVIIKALVELWCNCEIQIFGDPVLAGESSILVMNHRTRTDWNFLWPAFYHCTKGSTRYRHSLKFVLKDMIRHIPGPGWVMQLSCFLYVKRSWMFDKSKLEKILTYFCEMSYKFSLLVFPEGTDLTPETIEASTKFAEKNNLQKYSYVLHPRTTGFAFIAEELLSRNNLDAVYDITLVYPDAIPQTEKVLLCGKIPKQVKFHFTRYPVSILPKTEPELRNFLEKRWSEKETTLREFHKTGHFLRGHRLKKSNVFEMYIALVFWTLLPYVTLYLFYVNFMFRTCVLTHTFFLLFVNYFYGGFQEFEVNVYKFKKKIFGVGF